MHSVSSPSSPIKRGRWLSKRSHWLSLYEEYRLGEGLLDILPNQVKGVPPRARSSHVFPKAQNRQRIMRNNLLFFEELRLNKKDFLALE